MQSGLLRVIPKNTLANLWKPIHNVIIIPVSSDPLNLETVQRTKKNQKIEHLKNEKSFSHVIKAIIHNF